MNSNTVKRAALVGVAALCTGVALAAPPAEVARSVRVAFGDLDLSRAEGAATLYERIEDAARSVCEPVPDLRELVSMQRYRECHRQAVASAVRRLDRETVTALHRSRTSRPSVG